jgi:hypothetical protein
MNPYNSTTIRSQQHLKAVDRYSFHANAIDGARERRRQQNRDRVSTAPYIAEKKVN